MTAPVPPSESAQVDALVFLPELARLVAEGRKTETRRPIREARPCRYQPGRVYPVRDREDGPTLAHVRVRSVTPELLGHVDAHAEGFDSLAEFKRCWKQIYGTLDGRTPVWVIAFELVEEGGER